MRTINTIIVGTVLAFGAGAIGHYANAAEYGRVTSVQQNYA